MNFDFSNLQNLSPPILVTAVAAAGAVITGLSYITGGGQIAIIVALVLIFIGLALIGFFLAAAWMRKKRAGSLGDSIGDAAVGSGPASAQAKAMEADLRQKFQEGIAKFRASGNDLYSLPWYLVIGESGSGKTELVRHCGIGFPPGLQDELQGVGGTINMNWWFTNKGVFIDTAGKIVFPEVEAGESKEWPELLKLLKKARRNCPINGVLLAIPANSLIKDREEDIQKKAGQIAHQLEVIKRTLEVRFPVYIVITKADLINGFREFFDPITDPQLQHQILGWNKPGSPDDSFAPEEIEQNLATIRDRLMRRRHSLLLDPPQTGDADSQPIDRVDSLYTFPESLMKTASWLRRYLELIFTPNPWSGKPSFFRGIYFTSAMRDGSALDQELADVLGVPVESLPDQRVWDKERPFFIRDLFVKKAFREQGLVTSAGNVGKLRRRRQAIVLGSGIVCAVLLIGLTWLSAANLSHAIGRQAGAWNDLATAYTNFQDPDRLPWPGWFMLSPHKNAEGSPAWVYRGGGEVTLGSQKLRVSDLPPRLVKMSQATIHKPWVFFWSPGGNLLADQREKAVRMIYEAAYLQPLMTATDARFADIDQKGTTGGLSASANAGTTPLAGKPPVTPAAQGEQLRQALAAMLDLWTNTSDTPTQLQPLFNLGQWTTKTPDDVAAVQQGQDALLTTLNAPWPASWLPGDSLKPGGPISQAVQRVVAYEQQRFDAASSDAAAASAPTLLLTRLAHLKYALNRFNTDEKNLIALADQYPTQAAEPSTLQAHDAAWRLWQAGYKQLGQDAAMVKAAQAALGTALNQSPDVLLKQAVDQAHQAVQSDFAPLLSATDKTHRAIFHDTQTVNSLSAIHDQLAQGQKQAEAQIAAAAGTAEELAAIQHQCQAAAGQTSPRYAVRWRIYTIANTQWSRIDQPAPNESLDQAAEKISRDLDAAGNAIQQLSSEAAVNQRLKQADRLAFFALRDASRYRRYKLIIGAVAHMPTQVDAIEALSARQTPLAHPTIPLSSKMNQPGNFDNAYNPAVFTAIKGLGGFVAKLGPANAAADHADATAGNDSAQPWHVTAHPVLGWQAVAKQVQPATTTMQSYLHAYTRYWAHQVALDARPDAAGADWPAFIKGLGDCNRVGVYQLNRRLVELAKDRASALKAIPGQYATRAKTIAAIQSEAAAHVGASFDDQCSAFLGRWSALTSFDTARQVLGALNPSDFRNQYLMLYQPPAPENPGGGAPSDPRVQFWSHAGFTGLQLLAAQGRSQARAALQKLQGDDQFPLVLDGDQAKALTQAQLAAAKKLVAAIGESTIPDATHGGTLAEGARIPGLDKVNVELNGLFGADQLNTKAMRLWFASVRQIVDMLAPADTQTTPGAAIVILNPATQSTAPTVPDSSSLTSAYGKMQYFEFHNAAGRKIGQRQWGQNAGAAKLDLPFAQTPITIDFYRDSFSNQPAGHVTLGTWSLVAALRTPGVIPPQGKSQVWQVPLIVKDAQNKPVGYYWIGLKILGPLPSLSAWPRQSTWPR